MGLFSSVNEGALYIREDFFIKKQRKQGSK